MANFKRDNSALIKDILDVDREVLRKERDEFKLEVRELYKEVVELTRKNGRLSMMVDFYESANWFYIIGTVMFAITSLLSSRMNAIVFWILFCTGAVLVCAGCLAWISKLRQKI